MPGAAAPVLDRPFFTLEYSEGAFVRRIPPGAADVGGGKFRYGEAVLVLPDPDPLDPEHALALPRIGGKALLSLLRRGKHPLIVEGPRLAPQEERLMELVLDVSGGRERRTEGDSPGGGPLRLILRRVPGPEWLPLNGLPRHRFCGGKIYEIVDEAELALLTESFGIKGGADGEYRFTLRGEEIPRFSGSHARLVYRFGDPALRRLLSEEAVFVPPGELSLHLSVVTGFDRGIGKPLALPLLKRGGRRYPALEVSRLMDREFILLDDRWVRREDLERAGLLPLGRYAGGEAIEQVKPDAAELFRRGGLRFDGRFSGFEWDEGLWKSRGGGEEVFAAHLEFLRTLGLSGGAGLLPHRAQGQALLRWIGELRKKAEDAAVTVLMERRYYDLYFAPLLPEFGTGDAPRLSAGAELRFYEDLRNDTGPRKSGGILVLVEPEEALFDEGQDHAGGALIAKIRTLEPALLLGVFSDTWRFLNDPGRHRLRTLFGIRAPGDTAAKYLFRDAAAALPLPEAHRFPPPAILRPAAQGPAPFFSTVEEKFRRLPTGDLLSELSCFGTEGKKAPLVPPGSRTLFFDRMNEGERGYFFYWRSAFRKGGVLKTAEAYIRLYVRELCLFTGKEGSPRSGPEENFRELLRLWRTYRETVPSLDGDLLRWLYDYAVLYGIEDSALPLLFPFVHDGPCPPLTDRYLYRTFIEENNGIGFADLLPLTGPAVTGSVFFSGPEASPPEQGGPGDRDFLGPRAQEIRRCGGPPGPLLAKDYAAVVNGVDRFLRERFRLRLFEFFYPPRIYSERRRAFEGMPLTGDSFYTDGGARFTLHRPLGAFLDDLFRYTEYRFRIRTGYERPRQAPPLEGVWRDIAGAVLEGHDGQNPAAPVRYAGTAFRETPPDQVSAASGGAGFSFPPALPRPGSPSLDRLREESDQVRELLLRPPGGPGQVPDGSVQVPGGSGQVPDGSGQAPGGPVQVPGGSGQVPDGSVQVPGGSGQVPDGSGQAPGGSGQAPGGSGQVPDGSVQVPDGSGQAPGGSGQAPGGSGQAPGGSGMFRNGLLRGEPALREGGGGMAAFLEGLAPVEAAALALIAGEEPKAALDALARRYRTMPEPVIDGINEKFLGAFGDLLIETMDEAPRIAAEYKETVKKTLTRRPEGPPDPAGGEPGSMERHERNHTETDKRGDSQLPFRRGRSPDRP
ncbi:MAG: hypothetical protein LBP23_08515 [Treponema sp.]|jgi:hypothetical protein|nr:hypothetical protein [Treponema sp.]